MELRPDGVDVDIADMEALVIDCDRCAVRGDACSDCVVSVVLGAPPELAWDDDEQRAVDALAEAGMVPRLRMVPGTAPGSTARTAPTDLGMPRVARRPA